MELTQALQELLNLEDQKVQFLSVYLNTSVNHEGKRNHLVFFDKKASEIVKRLEQQDNGQAKTFKENIKHIKNFLNTQLSKDTRGVAIFSSAERSYFKALQLPVPVKNKFVVSRSPNLDVLIELVKENKHYCVLLLDQHWGKISSVFLCDVLESRQIKDELVPGRTKVGGWSQMRYQRHRKDHIQHFMRELAELLERFVRHEKPDSIILLGTQTNMSEFRKHLSNEVAHKILLTKNVSTDIEEPKLIEKIRGYIEKAEAEKDRDVASRLYESLAQDYKAVAGLDDTLFNLQMGKLDKLVLSRNFDGKGYKCSKCGFLFGKKTKQCVYCQGAAEEVEIRNHMEKIAEHQSVEIELLNERTFLDSMGGVGGFLKF